MPTLLRRFLLWTVICVVSAAPSFAFASHEFDVWGMVAGVVLFICAYTALTTTEAFGRFHRRPFIRRTLYIGYGARLAVSFAFPIGMGADMMPGMLSVAIIERVLGPESRSFIGTLATTCVQGALLNAILFVFMAALYSFQRAFMRPPEEPRGFSVILPAEPTRTDA